MINEGIYLDLSSEDYHNDKSSISRTSLMDFKRNPKRYWAKHLNPNRPIEESKPSWEFGAAFHTLILEPHLFENQYCLEPSYEPAPQKVLLNEVGRPAYEAYKAEKAKIDMINDRRREEHEEKVLLKGKKVLSLESWHKLQDMRTSLMSNQKARDLIEGAIYESSYFWKDEHSGLMVKSRPDILQGNIYIDLKTIDDASPSNFQREMVKYGYHIQAAILRDGLLQLKGERLAACINLCVEKTYPYGIGIYIIDEEAIDVGHQEYKQLLLDLKHAIVYSTFQDYPPQIIGLPKWAL